jgi:hypothetical protein
MFDTIIKSTLRPYTIRSKLENIYDHMINGKVTTYSLTLDFNEANDSGTFMCLTVSKEEFDAFKVGDTVRLSLKNDR